jgi:hypothetical protein
VSGPRDELPWVEPDDGDPEQIAGELFADGLLQWHALDRGRAQQRRVEAVLRAIDGRRPRRGMLLAASAAALLLACAGAVWWAARGGSSRAPADRRYRVTAWMPFEPAPTLVGELDVRDRDHHVLRVTLHDFMVRSGRDGASPWLTGDDGMVAHLREQFADPHHFLLGGGLAVLDSAATLLPELERAYALGPPAPATLSAHPGVTFEHRHARGAPGGGQPRDVEVWIDPRSGRVQRMELRWEVAPGGVPARTSMVVEHIADLDLPEGWFRAASHGG